MSLNNMSSETIYPGQKIKVSVHRAGSFLQAREELKKTIEFNPEDQAKVEEEIGIYLGLEEFLEGESVNPDYGLKRNDFCGL